MYVDKCVMSRSTFIPLKYNYRDEHIIMYVIKSNNYSMRVKMTSSDNIVHTLVQIVINT